MTQYREAKVLSARPLVSTRTTGLRPLWHRPQVWDATIMFLHDATIRKGGRWIRGKYRWTVFVS